MSRAEPMRVLLVDDDEAFLATARELLALDDRVEVVGAAREGEEALTLAERTAPDLVLMDVGLPARDGVQITRELHERQPGLPVVMLTGRTGREDSEAAAAVGAIGYLQKDELGEPHFADSLLALIELS